jgi:hypothetical protein
MNIVIRGVSIFCLLFCFLFFVSFVSAQTPASHSSSVVTYELAYPGMLPGNPFYFVKVFRDTLVSFFTSNPLARAEFDLLRSDKYMNAALLLSLREKKDYKQILQTVQESESFFQESMTHALAAKKQGMNIIDFSKHLRLANSKHREIVVLFVNQFPQEKEQWRREQEKITQRIKSM